MIAKKYDFRLVNSGQVSFFVLRAIAFIQQSLNRNALCLNTIFYDTMFHQQMIDWYFTSVPTWKVTTLKAVIQPANQLINV